LSAVKVWPSISNSLVITEPSGRPWIFEAFLAVAADLADPRVPEEQGIETRRLLGLAVDLAKTAKLVGDVTHKTLAVEPGAFFQGQCRRIDGAQS